MARNRLRSTMLGFLTVMFSSSSISVSAQTCPCNYMVCAVCVQSTLPAIKTATTSAFKSLSALQNTMDTTIEVGVNTEIQSIYNYKNNIVAALQADAMNTATSIELGRESQQRLLDALRSSIETSTQTGIVARTNLKVSENYGQESVSFALKARSNSQYAKITKLSELDEFKVEDDYYADLSFLIRLVNSRKSIFINKIMTTDKNDDHHFQMVSIMNGIESNDYKADVLSEELWSEAFALRRFIATPLDVQSSVSALDLKSTDQSAIAVIKARAKTATEFVAWDMAIRSSIVTDAGETSLLDHIKTNVLEIYESDEAMIDAVSSGEREILTNIATNEAIGAVLDMLILETNAYQLRMEGAKLGAFNDERFSPVYGYKKIDTAKDSITRGF
jgi:hypothetical protein